MKKTGLVLGGGGARGLSHVGVLKVLEKNGVKADCVAGTSMGAIIGACYAACADAGEVESRVRKALSGTFFSKMKFNILREKTPREKKTIFSKAQDFIKYGYLHIVEETKYSLLAIDSLEKIISELLPDADIRDLKLPFACVATDLTNGRGKIFTEGPLRARVLASSSIPGVFPPVSIDGVYYSDGGAVSVTPVPAAKLLGADFTIAVDVKSKIIHWEKPEMAKEIISRCNYITGVLLNDIQIKEADAVISPAVKYMHWSEFDKLDFMIHEGEKAASAKLLEIKARSVYRGITSGILGFFRRPQVSR